MKHIIIVDDRLENRYMLESLLKGFDYKISTAKNGLEALSLARRSIPDLAISDILMPVMDGFTLCKEWRQDELLKNIPFIFYTAAYTSPQDIKYALRLGADRFLIKPQEPSEFLTVIKEVLEQSEMGRMKSKPEVKKSEIESLKEYNAVLFRKLEDKLIQTEQSDKKLKQYALEIEQNIQKLKISDENLRQTRNYLDNLINFANAPFIVWNPQFKIIRLNRAFEDLTGYNSNELLGQNLEMLFPDSSKKESFLLIEKTLGGEHLESKEIPVLTKQNDTRIILWNSAPIYDKDGKTLISTIAQGQNITELKKAEETLRASEAKLKEINTTKDKFFSIIAHDLKNPFNAIMGFSNILKDEAHEMDIPTIQEYADMINRAAVQVFRLLDNLLNWARIQQDQIPFNPTTLILKEITDEMIELMRESAARKQIVINNLIADELTVKADSDMLKSIFRNLLSNAIKFTSSNGKVELDAVKDGDKVKIAVNDNGRGMSKENLDKLFKLDIGYSTRGTENEEGTGLGLILCKEFIEKHGGTFSVESELDIGSRFSFTLPT